MPHGRLNERDCQYVVYHTCVYFFSVKNFLMTLAYVSKKSMALMNTTWSACEVASFLRFACSVTGWEISVSLYVF